MQNSFHRLHHFLIEARCMKYSILFLSIITLLVYVFMSLHGCPHPAEAPRAHSVLPFSASAGCPPYLCGEEHSYSPHQAAQAGSLSLLHMFCRYAVLMLSRLTCHSSMMKPSSSCLDMKDFCK